ncbi:MAG TPA: serine/threonine-protein kinase [Kofleriaceae bacterium]|nr:serine/threonine-protein kinase [Kofleriaceae bacterium]
MADAEPTEALTAGGTQAASPHAIAQASAIGSQTGSAPRASATSHAVDASTKVHAFHVFGTLAPLAAIPLFAALGGDPIARTAAYIGAVALAACNALLAWITANPSRYRASVATTVWMVSVASAQPLVYYFGPFSGSIAIELLGIMFVSFGRVRWTAVATTIGLTGGHVAMAMPVALHLVHDRGLLSADDVPSYQLVVSEILLATLLVLTFVLGRWARRTNVAALTELKSAMQQIGDKEQALAEVKADAERAARVDEGRWTGHQMGSFRLGLVLGRGGMGEVYEATGADGAPAAVKLLNARATTSGPLVERFHREMAVAARLESPHIVKVLELSPPEAPVPYIAMERLHGIDLATQLRAEPRLPADQLVVLLDQVAHGLEVARVAGVVHRDLKPHNLIFHAGATWKILDFGVSKLVGNEGTLTGEGVVGTPQYMAPEQASGGDVTHAADVYALGAIAYRCLTGRSPFKGNDLSELLYQLVHAAPARPSTLARVAPAIEDVLAVAMAKDPRRRFDSALEFARAFVAARRGRSPSKAPPPGAWRAD